MAALVKEKVTKIAVYDSKDRYIATTKVFSFPKELFKAGGKTAVSIKGQSLNIISKGDFISLIFEYAGGTRHKAMTRVDASARCQIDVHVGDVEELEERRSSFKINTREKVIIYRSKDADAEGYSAMILNINIGGVLLKSDISFSPSDIFYLSMLDGELEIRTCILRKQLDLNGTLIGYGCQFQDVTDQQEEAITKFIFDCQIAERERRKRLEEEAELAMEA
ncbi:MAG: PilZ domain-containing protein [Oscillospiraceae bacterium]|nr:PilZ domain-containing protein [Oscillospiraceae bacterium]